MVLTKQAHRKCQFHVIHIPAHSEHVIFLSDGVSDMNIHLILDVAKIIANVGYRPLLLRQNFQD